jgi:hypothetical protein
MSKESTKSESVQLSSLQAKLAALKAKSLVKDCSVCRAMDNMDTVTLSSFIDVMKSTVTISEITMALQSEGIQVNRFAVGEARRKCVKNSEQSKCQAFSEAKNGN